MALFFDSIHEKYWDESINLYENLEIIRNSLDDKDKLYVLLRDAGKGYDVNLEIINNEFESFCSCSSKEDEGCQHAEAALIYKMLKEKENDFNTKLCADKKFSGEVELSDLNYFKNLLPKKEPYSTLFLPLSR